MLALRSPHIGGSYGVCPLLALTGFYCAGCGALRATHDLAHLDLAGAWRMNPLWTVLAPLVVAGLGWWTWSRLRELRALRRGELPAPRRTPSPAWAYGCAALLVVFSVLRNVPALMPWLAPGL